MLLDVVTVSGFRSIESDLTIRVGSPTILAGHNDAGKSAVLDAIAFLLDSVKLTDRDRTYGDAGPDGEPSRVSETMVEGTFTLRDEEQILLGLPEIIRVRRAYRESGTALEVFSEVPVDERLRDISSQDVKTFKFRLGGLGLSQAGNKSELIERLEQLISVAVKEPIWIPATADLKRALPRIQRFDATSSQNPEEAILATLRNSYTGHTEDASIKGDIRELTDALQGRVAQDAEKLREHIKSQCIDIGDIEIHPVVRLDSGLKSLEVSAANGRGERIHLGQSGTGRSRRVALAVWEFNAGLLGESSQDTVLLYDEPDTHLDYSNQRGFMKLLDEQSKLPNVRTVVATHSMNLIDGVDISKVVHLRHVDNRTKADEITDDSDVGAHLGAIAASLGLRNTVLLHERLFVGVEGPTESRAFPVLFKLATGRQLQACGIALWPCDNNDGALRFAQYLAARERDVLLVVDEDSRELKMFSEQRLANHGLQLGKHVLTVGVREFEDTFRDQQWAECANRVWPRADGRAWVPDDFSQHRASKFSSKIESMIRENSSVEVSGKPEIMTTLALGLRSAEEVPEELREVFRQLVERADY
ncbi:ATP-dependent nuclease [Paenarthrobacter sp. NPDC090520]|uniref:ATP-dependent nuclease n=1 Tax=Paenarthrobacter sp. NPDC090520 TaxID=3364382 RepID=UPI0038100CBA